MVRCAARRRMSGNAQHHSYARRPATTDPLRYGGCQAVAVASEHVGGGAGDCALGGLLQGTWQAAVYRGQRQQTPPAMPVCTRSAAATAGLLSSKDEGAGPLASLSAEVVASAASAAAAAAAPQCTGNSAQRCMVLCRCHRPFGLPLRTHCSPSCNLRMASGCSEEGTWNSGCGLGWAEYDGSSQAGSRSGVEPAAVHAQARRQGGVEPLGR